MEPRLELGRKAGWQAAGPKVWGVPTSMLRITWPRRMAASLSRWSSWYSQAWRSGGRACRAESVGHSIVKGLWDTSRNRGSRPATCGWGGGREGRQSQPTERLVDRDRRLDRRAQQGATGTQAAFPPATLQCSHCRWIYVWTCRDKPAHPLTVVKYVGIHSTPLFSHWEAHAHTQMCTLTRRTGLHAGGCAQTGEHTQLHTH